jgi:protein pelota
VGGELRSRKGLNLPGIDLGISAFTDHDRDCLKFALEHGVDAGSHHTISVETGFEISVIRQWRPIDLERVERAVKASVYGVIHILTIEEGEAELFRLRQYGPESVITITAGSGKGAETGTRTAFFDVLLSHVQTIAGPLIIAGPGFVKDDFVKYAKSRSCTCIDRAVVVETRRIGRGAVQEVVGKGALEKLMDDIQLSREVKLMDEVLLRIAQDGAVAYGIKEVREAVGYGAAEQVLVADTLLRDAEVMRLIDDAEAMRATIVVLSSEFEPGERLVALGGIAALLRYNLTR